MADSIIWRLGASYAHKRKGLRVSSQPQGAQRFTYFLQLPYRFSIPLLTLSGALHWMVSQSIFVVAIDVYDAVGDPGTGLSGDHNDFTTLGFSPIAIVSVIVVALVMVVFIVGIGFMPYKRGMPLVGSNSMAISAACHTVEADETHDGVKTRSNAATKRVRWGVMRAANGDEIGHCGFSAEHVEAPVEGELYA
jgi:hypothetical protein